MSTYDLGNQEVPLTFSFSFCAFFSAFFEGGSAPAPADAGAGAASLIVAIVVC